VKRVPSELRALRPPMVEQLEDRLLLSLLGVNIEYPQTTYDVVGTLAYNATAQTFDSQALPTAFRLSPTTAPVVVKAPRNFQLHFRADNNGNVIGGVEGTDLLIEGQIDINRDNIIDYDGVLLTAEIYQFGFLDAGVTDQYDFRLIPTGGDLLPYFAGQDVGMRMTSPNSTFTGSFGINFQGEAHGIFGPIDLLAEGSIAGSVFVDADNDGNNDAEAGIQGVNVTLTGTDYRGASVNRTVTTAADGTYAVANLLPGTYALTEAQPAAYLDGSDAAGTLGGLAGDDVISEIQLTGGQNGTGYNFGEVAPSSLSGQVLLGSGGIAGVTINLTGLDDRGAAVSLTAQTDANGAYVFDALRPGTYTINEVQPAGLMDGSDSAGTLGGLAGDDVISEIQLTGGQNGTGYNFGEIAPSSLSGFAWVDFNDDGEIDFNEKAIEGVTVNLTGVDDRGAAVSLTAQTDADGVYVFDALRPGTYAISEIQPAGLMDGLESLGTAGGIVGNDVFQQIPLGAGIDAVNYNFGERPLVGTTVIAGQTATIGFWQNKNGQALIRALNGGATATQLGSWLAASFQNLYANLAGMTNNQVADYYRNLFSAKSTVRGPAKVNCQVMATALAVYATNSSLAGTAATRYGFLVTDNGVGIATWNVGTGGLAFGVANNTTLSIMDLLLATDSQSGSGQLYNLNILLRELANAVYTAINEAGDIG